MIYLQLKKWVKTVKTLRQSNNIKIILMISLHREYSLDTIPLKSKGKKNFWL